MSLSSDFKEAKKSALRALARKSYLTSELRQKLLEKGYSSGSIEQVLEEFLAKGYLEDATAIEGVIRGAMARNKGPLWIAQKLKGKGASLSAVAVELEKSYPKELQREIIQRLLSKKEGPKGVAYAARQGFSFEDIFAVVRGRNSYVSK